MTRQSTHHVRYRTTTDLTGDWEFVTDPDDEGREAGWQDPDGIWPARSHPVTVPHSWQEDDRYRDFTGTAWYRRRIDLDAPDDRQVRLRFDAVDYETDIWVNGTPVGGNAGGYLPFTVNVTDAVSDGDDTLVVAVTDPKNISEIPHGKQGEPWYQRVSGIWQDVTVQYVPQTRVENVRLTPDLDADTVSLEGTVVTDEAADLGAFTARVAISQDGETLAIDEFDVGSDGTVTGSITLDDPDYWTPESPTLYDVTVSLVNDGTTVDEYEDYFGMRSVAARDGQLFLNGEPYYMRGALDQGYYPETLYRPFDEDLFEEEIRTAKELGFNLLRKHIKPAHPDFLKLADEIGILVWEEPANPSVYSERSKTEVRDQTRGLIERDYNRPSVIVWSLYNEEWGIGGHYEEAESLWTDEEKQAYLADLYEGACDWDPSRVICDNSGWAHVATDVNDYHRYFVSPDRAGAWSDDIDAMTGSPEDNYAATETDPDEAPLIVSEFGTWGLCDLPAVEEHYGSTPPWFDYEFFDDPIKRPAGVYDRYEATTLPDVFDDWGGLAEAWQGREYRSIKDVIEQMRSDPAVAGYVITEFSDIEWEFNGMLDYCREEKAFHDDLNRFNDDVMLRADLDDRVLEPGDALTADLVVANDTSDTISGEVEWSFLNEHGIVTVDLDGYGVTRVPGAIKVTVPDVDDVTDAELWLEHPKAPENYASITVIPTSASDAGMSDAATTDATTVYADAQNVGSVLEDAGFEVREALDDAVDVAVVTDPDPDVETYTANGGTTVRIPAADGSMIADEFFEYRDLPEDESWNLVASLFYIHDGPLATYSDDVPGWEYEGLYPYDVVADVDDTDDIEVGYVEGWIANWSAAVTRREYGDGTVAAFTFRITDAIGEQPAGTGALVDYLASLAQQ